MSAVDTIPWHASHDNIVALAHHLHDEEGYDADQLLGFIEKPWNYDTEWANFQADENDPYVSAVYLSPANSQASADDYYDAIGEYATSMNPDGTDLAPVSEAAFFERDGRWYVRLDARTSVHQPIAVRFGLVGWST